MKFTKAQNEAIQTNKHNILVNAAAGSGKTAVLVERLFRKIENNQSVHNFIVITFTKLAASEMRHRLRARLESAVASETSEVKIKHFSEQLNEMSTANISTIDAFCSKIVNDFGFLLDEYSGLRHGKTSEISAIEVQAFQKLFTTEYFQTNKNTLEKFLSTSDVTQQKLYKILSEIQNLFTGVADVNAEYDRLLNLLQQIDKVEDVSGFQSFLEIHKLLFIAIEDEIEKLHQHAYLEQYATDIENIKAHYFEMLDLINKAETYHEVKRAQATNFPKKPRVKSDEKDEVLDLAYTDQRSKIKDEIKQFQKTFETDEDLIVTVQNQSNLELKILLTLTYHMYKTAQKMRFKAKISTFSDIAQLAYELLQKNEVKAYFSDQITEVLIDEYQDTTKTQEQLFQTFAAKKLFLVGDMKQAIYRFRQSDPKLFIEKNSAYRLSDDKVIDLNENFRSRENVLNQINVFFSKLLDERLGELAYDENAKLYFGQHQYDNNNHALGLIQINNTDPLYERGKTQALAIVQEIKNLFKNDTQVFDGENKTRKIQYSDIALISRNNKSDVIEHLCEQLDQAGIPYQRDGVTNFSNFIEVVWIENLLKVIVNPYDDIALLGVLRSPIFEMTLNEIYEVTTLEEVSLFEKLEQNMGNKSKKVVRLLKKWIKRTFSVPASRLVEEILNEINFEYKLSTFPNSARRFQSVQTIINELESIEDSGYIAFDQEVFLLSKSISENTIVVNTPLIQSDNNFVTIQTFHKSKGLEYPFVFLFNLQKKMNVGNKNILTINRDLGLAMKYVDVINKKSVAPLALQTIKLHNEIAEKSEELRLLYVGMTRAREKLYLVGESSEVFSHAENRSLSILSFAQRRKATSMFDWISLVFNNTSLDVEHVNFRVEETNENVVLQDTNDNFLLDLEHNYGDMSEVPIKTSVTEIKRRLTVDGLYANNLITETDNILGEVTQKPTLEKDFKITPMEVGVAIHTVFEHLDFKKCTSILEVASQINAMIDRKLIDKRLEQKLNARIVYQYLQTSTGLQLKSENVRREMPFRMMVEVNSLKFLEKRYDDIEILIQGVIDAVCINANKIIAIDFKSDYINHNQSSDEIARTLTSKYTMQAQIYLEALKRLYPNNVVEIRFSTIDDGRSYTFDENRKIFTLYNS